MSTYPSLKQRRSLPVSLPGDSDELKQTRAILKEARQLIHTLLGSANTDQMKCNDVADVFKLAQALTGISKAEIEMSRLLVDRTEIINAAKQQIFTEIKQSLESDPVLHTAMQKFAEQAAQRMIDGGPQEAN